MFYFSHRSKVAQYAHPLVDPGYSARASAPLIAYNQTNESQEQSIVPPNPLIYAGEHDRQLKPSKFLIKNVLTFSFFNFQIFQNGLL